MVEQDTIRLLRECDSGIKMGLSAISEVRDYAKNDGLKQLLCDSQSENEALKADLQKALDDYSDEGKDPPAAVQGMSWLKTNVKLKLDESDGTIAELMIDGCNMGVKSLSRYLNQYKAADERSKDITKRLISAEERLSQQMRQYL